MNTTKVEFYNKEDQKLIGRLELPVDRHPHNYALFAHCFTCTKNLSAVRNISKALTSNGFAVLRFDFTGLGESEGDFADTNFSGNVEDLVAASKYLAENYQATLTPNWAFPWRSSCYFRRFGNSICKCCGHYWSTIQSCACKAFAKKRY